MDADDPNAGASAAGAMSLPTAGTAGSTATAGMQGLAGASAAGTSGSSGVASTAGTGGVSGMAAGAEAGAAGEDPMNASDAAVDASTASDAGLLDAGLMPDGSAPDDGAAGRGEEPLFDPVYRVALRVHRGESALSDEALLAVLDEVNWIWWSQAAVCFEIEIVTGDEPMSMGFDLWFHSTTLGCSPGANGVYCGDHDIHSLDRPSLGRVDNAEWDTEHDPSRTSAHELGHALSLGHYDDQPDSPDSLMASGRQGWKLHDFEVNAARNRAMSRALADTSAQFCGMPVLVAR